MVATARSQAPSKFIPSVVALYPTVTVSDSIAAVELLAFVKQDAITEEFRREYVRDGLPPNWKLIREKELPFIENQDFYSTLELAITRELTYREMENRVNLLIYPSTDKSVSDLQAFKQIADSHKVSWVLSITRVETAVKADVRKLAVTVQLYNVITHRVYLSQSYTQTTETLADAAACESVWLCLADMIKDSVVTDVADRIEKNIRHFR